MAISWIQLTQINQVDTALKNSVGKTIVFFKHSTRCIVSKHALRQFEIEWNFNAADIEFYFLDLLSFREISNYISEVTGVYHQSPQIIVLKENSVIYHASHESISAIELYNKLT
jgi:bacillithiol system protein YtxJ